MDIASTLILIAWLLSGLIGLQLGSGKGHPEAGLILGLLLGPIGWLAAMIGQPTRCAACQSAVHKRATRCPHCHTERTPEPVRRTSNGPVPGRRPIKR